LGPQEKKRIREKRRSDSMEARTEERIIRVKREAVVIQVRRRAEKSELSKVEKKIFYLS